MRNLPQVPQQFFKEYLGFDSIVKAMLNDQPMNIGSYPPYDIIKQDNDNYTISVAVSGHKPEDLAIEVNADGELEIYTANCLSKSGVPEENQEPNYIHHGISKRNFCLKFRLDKHIKVSSAEYENGILSINLMREVPETYVNRIKITQK